MQILIASFFFFLPWQTIWIIQEQFLNESKWQYGTLGFFATEILLWGSIFAFITYFVKEKKLKTGTLKTKFTFSKDRIFLLWTVFFLLYIYSSVMWSIDRNVAQQQSFHIMEAVLMFLILYLVPFDSKKLVKYFIFGATLQSILGIYQFLTQSTFVYKWLGLVLHPVLEAGTSVIVGDNIGRVMRAYGAFSHPNVFGGYLFVSITLTTFLFLKEPAKNTFQKLFQASVLGLQIVTLFFTFSRSAWIATSLFFLYIFISSFKNKFVDTPVIAIQNRVWEKQFLRHLSFYFVVLFTFCTVAYWPLVYTRVAHQSSHEIQSTEERTHGYKEAFQIWKTSPWVGVGAGNYTLAVYKMNPNQAGYLYQPVHSVPLLFLTEFGVIGCVFLFGVMRSFWKFALQNRAQKYSILLFVALLILFSLFDHYLYSSYFGLILTVVYLSLIFRFLLHRN